MNCLQAMAERFHPIGERRQFAKVYNLSKKVCNDFQVSITRTSSTRTCTSGSTVCRCFDRYAPDGEEDDAVYNHDGNDDGHYPIQMHKIPYMGFCAYGILDAPHDDIYIMMQFCLFVCNEK